MSRAKSSRFISCSTEYATSGASVSAWDRIAGNRSASSSLHTHIDTSRHHRPTHSPKIPQVSNSPDRRKHEHVISGHPDRSAIALMCVRTESSGLSIAFVTEALTLLDLPTYRLTCVAARPPFVVAHNRSGGVPPIAETRRRALSTRLLDLPPLATLAPREDETRRCRTVGRSTLTPQRVGPRQ